MATIISFNADLSKCTNLSGHKNEAKINSGSTFLFSPYGDEIWIMNGNEAIWSERIFFNNDGTFSIA